MCIVAIFNFDAQIKAGYCPASTQEFEPLAQNKRFRKWCRILLPASLDATNTTNTYACTDTTAITANSHAYTDTTTNTNDACLPHKDSA